MYIGVSKRSAHIKIIKNLNFNEARALSSSNQPESLAIGSIVHRFDQSLAELTQQGFTEQYYLKHLGSEFLSD